MTKELASAGIASVKAYKLTYVLVHIDLDTEKKFFLLVIDPKTVYFILCGRVLETGWGGGEGGHHPGSIIYSPLVAPSFRGGKKNLAALTAGAISPNCYLQSIANWAERGPPLE